jgi:chemotaxis protein methyltransferase WspC
MPHSEIETILAKEIGLVPESIGRKTLDRAIKRRVKATGAAEHEAYMRRLRGSQGEVQALIEEVVVRNSWFFREPRSFDLLRECVAEGIPTTGQPGPAIRALSLGCAGGEEPYSIVMTLSELPSAPTFSVDAVDVSARALENATTARYRPASFFGGDLTFRSRFFEERDGEYTLDRKVVKQTTLIQGNVMSPKLARQLGRYNVVFCRNLLIYFNGVAQRRVVALIRKVLCPGGYLFVGCVDRAKVGGAGFTPITFPGAFAFQRVESEAADGDRSDSLTPVARGTFLIPALETLRDEPAVLRPVPMKPPAALDRPAAGKRAEVERPAVERPTDEHPAVAPLAPLGPPLVPTARRRPLSGPLKPVKSRTDRLLNCETQLIQLKWLEGQDDDEELPCWKREGIFGEACCLHLDQLDSCYYCPVFCNQGRALFERPVPRDYRASWTNLLRQPKPEPPSELTSILVFRLWEERFALGIDKIIEVGPPGKVHSVPNRTGRIFRGLMNVVGSIRLCVSLHELLELIPTDRAGTPAGQRPLERMILIGEEDEIWAFWADEVYGIHRYLPAGLSSASEPGTSQMAATFIKGTTAYQEHGVRVLDGDLLLAGLKRVIQ